MSNVTHWDPFQEMLTLREAMNQLFEESVVNPATVRGTKSYVPALDLSETTNGYTVELAVPGLKAENLEVTVENNILTIKGEIKRTAEETQRQYHRVERRYGAFTRTIGLPSTVQADAIQAELHDGILRLEIPKAEAIKPRKISVNVANGPIEVSNN
ncbi:MAG: Hsp20/alpha crystallin family protein [Roseiflexaceae bacterium]